MLRTFGASTGNEANRPRALQIALHPNLYQRISVTSFVGKLKAPRGREIEAPRIVRSCLVVGLVLRDVSVTRNGVEKIGESNVFNQRHHAEWY